MWPIGGKNSGASTNTGMAFNQKRVLEVASCQLTIKKKNLKFERRFRLISDLREGTKPL